MLRHPLAEAFARAGEGSPDAALALLPRLAKLGLRAGDEARDALDAALGFPLPRDASTSREQDGLTALRLGPDEWLLLGPEGEEETLARRLREGLGERFATVVDVTHQLVGLELRGRASRLVLAAGCRLDLHPQAMAEGFASRTLLGKVEVILHRRPDADAAPVFRLLVRRSFADHLWRWLLEAGREHRIGRG